MTSSFERYGLAEALSERRSNATNSRTPEVTRSRSFSSRPWRAAMSFARCKVRRSRRASALRSAALVTACMAAAAASISEGEIALRNISGNSALHALMISASLPSGSVAVSESSTSARAQQRTDACLCLSAAITLCCQSLCESKVSCGDERRCSPCKRSSRV